MSFDNISNLHNGVLTPLPLQQLVTELLVYVDQLVQVGKQPQYLHFLYDVVLL